MRETVATGVLRSDDGDGASGKAARDRQRQQTLGEREGRGRREHVYLQKISFFFAAAAGARRKSQRGDFSAANAPGGKTEQRTRILQTRPVQPSATPPKHTDARRRRK
jgi:hypothetical protein